MKFHISDFGFQIEKSAIYNLKSEIDIQQPKAD